MIVIEKVLVSEDLLDQEFVCNLSACKGACCVEGDEGAILTQEEAGILKEVYHDVKEYLTEEGRNAIEENQAYYTPDAKGNPKTTLIDGAACAYIRYENGIAFCGIERAWQDGKTWFRKPVSCHLYPVRTLELEDGFEAVNYERWEICKPACEFGKKNQVPVYKFLKEALIRKFGEDFYEALDAAAEYREEQV